MKPINLPETVSSIEALTLYVGFENNSKQPEHRRRLREWLFAELQTLQRNPVASNIIDVKERPKHQDINMSLSHCPVASACAWVDNDFLIGVDIEQASRIDSKVIARVSGESEIENCPDISMLFCAKEAAWKALSAIYPDVAISYYETFDWQRACPDWMSFKVRTDGKIIDGQGFARPLSGTYLSFFLSPSTFGENYRLK